MQDNTHAPSQAFYKSHWLPGILFLEECTTYLVGGGRGSEVGRRLAPARSFLHVLSLSPKITKNFLKTFKITKTFTKNSPKTF